MKQLFPFILYLLRGRVLIAHNAPFEEMFLFHEAQRAGVQLDGFSVVDTLSLARATLDLPNHKLPSICKYLDISLTNAHQADEDAYATGLLYIELIKRRKLVVLNAPLISAASTKDIPARPSVALRPPKVRKGNTGYMSNLLAALPSEQLSCDSQADSRYTELLEQSLCDGQLTGNEAQRLADLAAPLGLSASRLTELNQLFLEAAYVSASSDGTITLEEWKGLDRLAKEVGRPDFFSKLQEGQLGGSLKGAKSRRCGNCQKEGHTRRACPELLNAK